MDPAQEGIDDASMLYLEEREELLPAELEGVALIAFLHFSGQVMLLIKSTLWGFHDIPSFSHSAFVTSST